MGNTAVKVFTHLCRKIYETGKWPADFLQTVIIPLEKKPNATECSDFRKQMPLRSQQNIYIDHFHVGDFFLPVPLMLRWRLLCLYLSENQTDLSQYGLSHFFAFASIRFVSTLISTFAACPNRLIVLKSLHSVDK